MQFLKKEIHITKWPQRLFLCIYSISPELMEMSTEYQVQLETIQHSRKEFSDTARQSFCVRPFFCMQWPKKNCTYNANINFSHIYIFR